MLTELDEDIASDLGGSDARLSGINEIISMMMHCLDGDDLIKMVLVTTKPFGACIVERSKT